MQSYITLIEQSLLKSATIIQDTASDALGALSKQHDISSLVPKWIKAVRESSNFTARRGFASALGHVSLSDYADVLELLSEVAENEADVEVKRNAVKSIGAIFSRLVTMPSTFPYEYADEMRLW
jgi:hypothetical protein